MRILAIVFAVLFVLAALMSLATSDEHPRRFQAEYAPGATANACEYLAWHTPNSTAEWWIAAILCGLLYSIESLRTALAGNIRAQCPVCWTPLHGPAALCPACQTPLVWRENAALTPAQAAEWDARKK
jgi:hypothetical protein